MPRKAPAKTKKEPSRAVEKRETQAVKIARTAAEVWDINAKDAGALAFVSRILVQAFLPHQEPDDFIWKRTNGDFTLLVKSGIGEENGKAKIYGIPYGTIPRLMLAWLNSEAIRNAQDSQNTNPNIISLGRSLSDFLEKIGIDNSGGKKGGITRFKKQAERLFRAEISYSSIGQNRFSEIDIKVSDGRFIFWDLKEPRQQTLWESSIRLSDAFYKLLINNPVPMDWRVLKAIRQSPMALDLYMWLTHRMSYLQKPVAIDWKTLQKQLGAEVADIHKFRQQVRTHAKKISTIWRELNIDTSQADCMHLFPSYSMLAPREESKIPKKSTGIAIAVTSKSR
jgi:Plasmid encoded RepA protein